MVAKAHFIVTEDVDDFDSQDLIGVGVAAVNPDLFLAERATLDGYTRALRVMSDGMANPPRTPEELHVRLGRQHPSTTAAYRIAYPGEPLAATHNPPAVHYRGNRCLHCLRIDQPLTLGVCAYCHPSTP
jgi:hypothetical protein